MVVGRHLILGDSVPSPEAFCPFGGLETLYSYLSSGGTTLSHAHLSNLTLFLAVAVAAVMARSAFCGWLLRRVPPFGRLNPRAKRDAYARPSLSASTVSSATGATWCWPGSLEAVAESFSVAGLRTRVAELAAP